jgi:WhiB family redox-sensing transcriptional regulator
VWGGFTESERLRLLATGCEDDLGPAGQVDLGRLEQRLGLLPMITGPAPVPAQRQATSTLMR